MCMLFSRAPRLFVFIVAVCCLAATIIIIIITVRVRFKVNKTSRQKSVSITLKMFDVDFIDKCLELRGFVLLAASLAGHDQSHCRLCLWISGAHHAGDPGC